MSGEGTDYTQEDINAAFDNLSDEGQIDILDDSDADEWDAIDPEDQLSLLQDHGHAPEDAVYVEDDGEDGEDGEDDEEESDDDGGDNTDVSSRVGTADQLAVEDELELYGTGLSSPDGDRESGPSIIVGGTQLPGATEITLSGEGTESQYLVEIEESGEGSGYESWEPSDDGGGGGGDDSGPRMGGSPTGGDEPPLHIEITGHAAQPTVIELIELREQDEVFDVQIGGETYEDMELHDFTRTLTGEQPYAYSIRVEVVEWREVELMDFDISEWFSGGEGDDSGGDSTDPEQAADDFESGTPGDPEVYGIGSGEQRDFHIGDGENASYAIFDTVPEDAASTMIADGEDWRANNLAWNAEDNRSGIIARGSGQIQTIFLGHGGDSGIVGEVLTQVDISGVNIEGSDNGIHLTDGVF